MFAYGGLFFLLAVVFVIFEYAEGIAVDSSRDLIAQLVLALVASAPAVYAWAVLVSALSLGFYHCFRFGRETG